MRFSLSGAAILSAVKLINLPFIPKSCSSVQDVTHSASGRRECAAWLGNECSYSHSIIYCEMLGLQGWKLQVALHPEQKTHTERVLFLLQWSLWVENESMMETSTA